MAENQKMEIDLGEDVAQGNYINLAIIAISVSAAATPSPDTIPERRLLLRVRWMHRTATGPTVIDAATPTQNPRSKISMISRYMLFLAGFLRKDTKTNLKFGPVSEKGRKRGSKGESLFYNVDKFSITLPSRVGRGIEKWIILSIHVKNSILWQRIKKWR